MDELLREAVSMGHAGEVDSLLSKGVDPEIRDENGYGLLHLSCSINDKNITLLLIKSGIDIDAVDEKWRDGGSTSPRLPNSPEDEQMRKQNESKAQALSEKTKELLERESDLIHREMTLRGKEAEAKRKLTELETKLGELAAQRSQYDANELQLKELVAAHTKNEFVSALCIVDSRSIVRKLKLGAGAFATVHKGIWRGTQVAIKTPFMTADNPQHGLEESDYVDLFHREIRLLAKLRHPNIVMLMGACLEVERPCMILKLCKTDLFALLHDQAVVLSPKKLLGFVIDAAQGILYMHTHSPPLLYRDVKSSNMLIAASGQLKLTDYGYSSFEGEVGYVFNKHKLTEKANRGTPAYMAIECLKDEEVTTKSDVFSFGVVLWEIMTRKIPWQGKSPEAVYAEVTTGSRLPLGSDSYFPAAFSELVGACWLEDPKERPTFKTILKVLRKIRNSFD